MSNKKLVDYLERSFLLVQAENMAPEPDRFDYETHDEFNYAFNRWIQGNYPMDDSY